MQGVDITPILKESSEKIRDCCLIEEDEEFMGFNIRVRHLITENYKLTVYNSLKKYGDLSIELNDLDLTLGFPTLIPSLWMIIWKV